MQIKQVFEHYSRPGQATGAYPLCPYCGKPLMLDERQPRARAACPGCGFVQYRNPAPAVSILVIEGERVALGKRIGDPGQGAWALPSGYIEFEEDFLSAARRGVMEETGLAVAIESLLNVVSSFVTPKFHFLGLYLAGRVVGGALKAGDDLEAVAWFPLEGPLPEMGFEEDVRALALYRSGFRGIPVEAA